MPLPYPVQLMYYELLHTVLSDFPEQVRERFFVMGAIVGAQGIAK